MIHFSIDNSIPRPLVVVRGGGDIATGVAHRLFRSGFSVLIIEVPEPTTIRRTVAFAEAVYKGFTTVEGVTSVLAHSTEDLLAAITNMKIPVMIDPHLNSLHQIKESLPAWISYVALVDATLNKKNIDTRKGMAPIVIGLGPGFEAGSDVDAVIETHRGHDLGRIYYNGCALPDTKLPHAILGYNEERVVRAPKAGKFTSYLAIGDSVNAGDSLGIITTATDGEIPVTAVIHGVLRGLINAQVSISEGMKIADIDPRGDQSFCYTISDKARAIGGSVLETVMYHLNRR